jgi:phosphonate metabolism protein (transferase hexapeptide repeat family)
MIGEGMERKKLSETPAIHPTAEVRSSTLGKWTEIYGMTQVIETTLGDYSYIVHGSQVIYAEIGKFCSLASFCRINPGNHPLERAALHHFTYRSFQFDLGEEDEEFFNWRRSYKVTLGNDVWVGHSASIMPGVHVGTGAAIGTGAVVTHDVPPFTVVAGVPARPIRERFPKEIQEELMRICWWDWPHEKLRERLTDFRRLDAAEFVKKYG